MTLAHKKFKSNRKYARTAVLLFQRMVQNAYESVFRHGNNKTPQISGFLALLRVLEEHSAICLTLLKKWKYKAFK